MSLPESFSHHETLETATAKIDAAVAAVPAEACRVPWKLVVDVGDGIPDITRMVPCSLAPHPEHPHHGLSPLAWQGPYPPVGFGGPEHDTIRRDYLEAAARAVADEKARETQSRADRIAELRALLELG